MCCVYVLCVCRVCWVRCMLCVLCVCVVCVCVVCVCCITVPQLCVFYQIFIKYIFALRVFNSSKRLSSYQGGLHQSKHWCPFFDVSWRMSIHMLTKMNIIGIDVDRISGQFLFYHDHNFTKSKWNLRFQLLVPLFVPIGVCVTTHGMTTGQLVTSQLVCDVTINRPRTTSATANLGFHSQSSVAM